MVKQGPGARSHSRGPNPGALPGLRVPPSLKSQKFTDLPSAKPPSGWCLGFPEGPVLGGPGNYTSQQTQRQLSHRDQEVPWGPPGGGKR